MLWEFLTADIECFEGIGAVGTVLEKIFVLTKKVQMKLCVTGGETKAAAHKGKALVLRWLGTRQRLYGKRRIRGNSASKKFHSLCMFLHFANIIIKLLSPDKSTANRKN